MQVIDENKDFYRSGGLARTDKQRKGEGMEQHLFFFIGLMLIAFGTIGRRLMKVMRDGEPAALPDNVVPISRGRLNRTAKMNKHRLGEAGWTKNGSSIGAR